ncbi:MAG: methyltransferase domain-containing protein [Gammaproteobacteria bacterium]|jgi:phosphatidylethanolamine/phosphatidyl-N-methylethanolamine N-methyltransferase
MESFLDKKSVENAYRRWAPAYDRLFGAVFEPGRQQVVDRMNCHPGERVLEVGVGTGLSLPSYPAGVSVTGIDLSSHMLDRARERVARLALEHVELVEMDAQELKFADASFDKVVAMYVVSVVPDLPRMLAEMRRVCRPGGDLFFVNHFSHERGPLRWLEKAASPLSRLVGFRPDLQLAEFLSEVDFEVVEIAGVNAFDYWTLIHGRTPA